MPVKNVVTKGVGFAGSFKMIVTNGLLSSGVNFQGVRKSAVGASNQRKTVKGQN